MREASSSSTIWPTLCRLLLYSLPGVAEADNQPGVSHGLILGRVRLISRDGGWQRRSGRDQGCPATQRRKPQAVRRLLSGSFRALFFFSTSGFSDADHQGVAFGEQDGTLRKDQVGSVDALAGLEAVDVDLDGGGNVGCFSFEGNRGGFEAGDSTRSNFTGNVDGDVDGNLLAGLHGLEVNVLDDLLNGIALDVLDERKVLLAVDVDCKQGVGNANCQRGGAARQVDVDGSAP